MKYTNIKSGKFISRPNRFIANIEIDGKVEVCHVKNTGRCKELLIPGVDVYVQESENPLRKTKYDLISVTKRDIFVNIDSQAPNKIFHEWVLKSSFFGNVQLIKPEYKYNNSRFDFYIEAPGRKILVEVKGVTLEENGLASFPDAPTLRGLKHINELSESLRDGYEAYVFFIIQMNSIHSFEPNRITQPEFADALLRAQNKGVNIKAIRCDVTQDTIEATEFVEVNLKGGGYFG